MKKINWLFCGVMLFCKMLHGQCPTDDFLIIGSQIQVDNFASQYPNCHEVPGSIYISGNNINNIEGLLGIKKIEGALYIRDNNNLISLDGLDSLESVGGDFLIEANSMLGDLFALEKLKIIGLNSNAIWDGFFAINVNNNLIDLSGLENLVHVEGGLFVQQNSNLETIQALKSLNSVGNAGLVIDNNKLTSLFGLDSIDYATIDTLVVKNCLNLSICNLSNICDYLENGGRSYIGNNLATCSNKAEVLLSCGISNVNDKNYNEAGLVRIFPNPMIDCVKIYFSDTEMKTIKIHDVTGKLVFEKTDKNQDNVICFDGLGVFILEVNQSDRVYSTRIVKIRG